MVIAEDDSGASVKNLGTCPPSYMTSHPDNNNVHIQCCENHKFHTSAKVSIHEEYLLGKRLGKNFIHGFLKEIVCTVAFSHSWFFLEENNIVFHSGFSIIHERFCVH